MNYSPIRISTIIPKKKLSFQLFIHYKNQYIRYKDNGEDISEDLIIKLKVQNLARFYILETEEIKYQNFLDEILESTLDNEDTAVEDKISIVEGTATSAVDQMQEHPESKASYDMTQKAANSLQKLISQNPDALKKFYGQAANEHEEIVKHCLNVSMLSVSVGKSCNLNTEDLGNLSVAGLLHDLGISRLSGPDQELFIKNHKEMSSIEKGRWEQHPKIAFELLERNPYVNPKILDLILHHEEKLGGTGYPDHLQKLELPQEILNICNCYDHKVTGLKMTPKQAIKSMQIDELGNYNLELINHLKDHLKKEGLT